MNLLLVVNVFPRISETFVLDQITYLLDRGYDVAIASLLRPEELSPADTLVHQKVLEYGLNQRLHYLPGETRRAGIASATLPEALRQTLDRCNLILAHFADAPTQSAEALARFSGVPYLFIAHARDIFVCPDVPSLRRHVTSSGGVIVPTDFNRRYLLDLLGGSFEKHVHLVRYGIDTRRFSPGDGTARRPGIMTVLSVGRLVEKKGMADLVRAFAVVSERFRHAVLRIIGDGPLRHEVEDLVVQQGLQSRVSLLGYRDHASVLDELRQADVFALASRTARDGDREGLPVALLEASAAGLPVVSTTHTGIPEGVIDGTTGFLVQEGDVSELAQRIGDLLASPSLREHLGMMGRDHVRGRFDMDEQMGKLMTIMNAAAR